MNKNILLLSCLLSGTMHTASIKEKIVDLRKALAVHSQSEMDSWNKLEEIDKRLAALEARLASQPLLPTHKHPTSINPQKKAKKHTQCKRYKQKMQRKLENAQVLHNMQTEIQKAEHQEQQSYFQKKAAYLSSLLESILSYIQNLPLSSANATQPKAAQPKRCKRKAAKDRTSRSQRSQCQRSSALKKPSPQANKITIRKSRRWTNRRPKE